MESKCAARTTAAGNLRKGRCRGYHHPSFSSTLLDAIYRSIDESSHDLLTSSRSRSQSRPPGGEEEVFFQELLLNKPNRNKIGGCSTATVMMMKSSSASLNRRSRVGDAADRKSRHGMVDRWMQKSATVDEDLVTRRRSLPPEMVTSEFAGLRSMSVMTNYRRRSLGSMGAYSSPGRSSDYNSGGRLSSYVDAELICGAKKQKRSLKPIRTSVSDHSSETSLPEEFLYRKNRSHDPRPPKSDSAGKSAKSRAMKIYADLKRMKKPISPGGKLANFFNSLFSGSGSSKKQRTSSFPSSAAAGGDRRDARKWERESNSNFRTNTTPSYSTASSYSRSCLTKRPSSAGRYECEKRSARFCPVSVIMDEDLHPCGHNSLRGSKDFEASMAGSRGESVVKVEEELKLGKKDKNRRVEEMALNLLRNYHKRKESAARKNTNGGVEERVDDDGGESCCSSDLFELEIGVDKYSEELPVYGTTRIGTNRAIASRRMA